MLTFIKGSILKHSLNSKCYNIEDTTLSFKHLYLQIKNFKWIFETMYSVYYQVENKEYIYMCSEKKRGTW